MNFQIARPRPAVHRSLGWGIRWASMWVVVNQVLKVARGLIVPKLLGPAHYGLFSSLSVILGYTQYADLGVYNQLGKRLPQVLAQEGEPGFRRLARLGATWELFTMLLMGGGVLVYSLIYSGPDQAFYRPALRIVAAVIVLLNLRTLISAMVLSRSEFKQMAIGSMTADIVSFGASITLLLAFGVIGLVWGLLCAEGVALAYFVHVVGFPGFTRTMTGLQTMVLEGAALLTVAVTEQTLMTTDQLFLLHFFTREQYGVYALGLFTTSALLAGSGIFLTAFQPRVMALQAQGQTLAAIETINAGLTLYLLGLGVANGVLVLVVDLVIHFYIPKYSSGMLSVTLMPLLALARAPVILLRPYFIAHNSERFVITCQLAGLVTTIGLDSMVVLKGGGLPLIALASVCGYTLVSALFCLSFEKGNLKQHSEKYGLIASVIVGICGLYWFYATRAPLGAAGPYIKGSLIAMGVYSAWVGLFIWLGRRRWLRIWSFVHEPPVVTALVTSLPAVATGPSDWNG